MDIERYAKEEQSKFSNGLMEMGGYETISNFYGDLSKAEYKGENELKAECDKIIKSWLCNYRMFTEFIMALNWKIWEFYDKGNDYVARLYNDLWEKAEDMFFKKYEGNEEATDYYYRVTD